MTWNKLALFDSGGKTESCCGKCLYIVCIYVFRALWNSTSTFSLWMTIFINRGPFIRIHLPLLGTRLVIFALFWTCKDFNELYKKFPFIRLDGLRLYFHRPEKFIMTFNRFKKNLTCIGSLLQLLKQSGPFSTDYMPSCGANV